MKNNHNKSLFWYGFRQRLKRGFGHFFIVISIISLMISLISNNTLFYILTGVLFCLGVYMAMSGASGEYDYKRQGGYIVYND